MYFDNSMAQVACLTIPEPKNPNSEPEKTVEEEKFSMVSDDFRVLYILGFQPAFLGISVWGCCFQAYFSTSLGWDLDSIILPRPWMKCEICADLREKPLGTGHSLTNKVLWHHHSDSMRYKVRLKGVYQECWKMLYCFFSFRIAYNIFFEFVALGFLGNIHKGSRICLRKHAITVGPGTWKPKGANHQGMIPPIPNDGGDYET